MEPRKSETTQAFVLHVSTSPHQYVLDYFTPILTQATSG
jgi:hypothetical protein